MSFLYYMCVLYNLSYLIYITSCLKLLVVEVFDFNSWVDMMQDTLMVPQVFEDRGPPSLDKVQAILFWGGIHCLVMLEFDPILLQLILFQVLRLLRWQIPILFFVSTFLLQSLLFQSIWWNNQSQAQPLLLPLYRHTCLSSSCTKESCPFYSLVPQQCIPRH